MPGIWDIVVPITGINIHTNPSFELNTTGWTAAGGSTVIARTSNTGFQRRGSYGLQVATGNGLSDGVYTTWSLSNGLTYFFGIDVMAQSIMNLKVYFADTSGNVLGTATLFTTKASVWERHYVLYTPVSSANHRMYIGKDNSAALVSFYIDGAHLEQIGSEVTYTDGDQPGCYWNGAEHASTSTRSDDYRSAGRIDDVVDVYKLYIDKPTGFGMAPIKNISSEYGDLPGALFQKTKVNPRILQMAAKLMVEGDLTDLHVARDLIVNSTRPDLTSEDNPMILRYRGANTVRLLKVVLDEGLLGGQLDGFTETLPLRFTGFDPFVYEDGEVSTNLNVQSTGTANRIVSKAADGTWSFLSGGANGNVKVIIYDQPRSRFIIGGDFTSIGGVAINRLAVYTPSTGAFTAMYAGAGVVGGYVSSLAVDSNGDVYIGGNFTSIDGVANTLRIAKWNGTVMSALSTGANGSVEGLAINANRVLFAVGNFTTIGGVALNRIATWNGSLWAGLASGGLDATGSAIVIGYNGYAYVTGLFTTAGGNVVNGVTYWDGATFQSMGGGLSPIVGVALARAQDGSIIVGGGFDTAGGVDAPTVARWNGFTFSSMGNDLGPPSTSVSGLYVASDGRIFAMGNFTPATGYPEFPGNCAIWNGSRWLPLDIDLDTTSSVTGRALAISPAGLLFYGWDQGSPGTAIASGITSVTNNSKADVRPRLVINGPTSGSAKIYLLANRTMDDEIHISGTLVVNTGERITLDLSPGNKSFSSNFQGSLIGYIQRGSDTGRLRLRSGVNKIALLSTSGTVTASLIWTNKYWSVDGGAVAS